LPFILRTQALILLFNAQVLGLLRQTIEAIEQCTKYRYYKDREDFQPAFMEADATDMRT
jgi:hypothetical protein